MVLLTYKVRLLLTVIGHLAIYVLGTNVAWALRKPMPGRLGQAFDFVRLWGSWLLLEDILRLAYYLLVPYWVLQYGWASPLDFGLTNLDWVGNIGVGSALGLGGLFLLVVIWWHYRRWVSDQPMMPQTEWLDQPWGWAFVLREALLLECWWALCRSPMLLWGGPYFGVYLGLVIVAGAALLNARVRYGLGVPGLREGIILTASLAMVSATVYVFTHNLWLCIAVHFLLRLTILHLARHRIEQTPICEVQSDL